MLPKITVDDGTCLGPHECGLCMKLCPMTVFIAGHTKVWKFRETDPKDYRVYARYYDQCVMCNKCVEACPVSAITITADEVASAAELLAEPMAEQPASLS
ncbi:MAG: 4Fe-4S dicluster domain-containing protein [Candidatus Abyssobacteria bacterium SURF_17]|uniref:4Fe-4S dicluster domain-containing protein n=1 Tax=Candidatus Abyssobacteria bacterium SURF_17 TaxID=2093361 RepID=A0A419EX05_9BACT|nr:MAG: 4Fe-4S dicluster domain-containing protein [Candidatus Abyssubacteria bacterium SURF_17]